VAVVELNLGTIHQLQGGAIFEQAQKLIQAAVTDCENRPGEERPRKVVLMLELTPITRIEDIDETHTRRVLDGVKLKFHMDVKCPTRRTIEIDCGVGEGHQILFNPDSPHNHRQEPLPLTFENEQIVPIRAG